jgi:hypothetical protein
MAPPVANDRSSNTGVSSGQEKDSLEQTINASDMMKTSGETRAHQHPAQNRDNLVATGAVGMPAVAAQIRVSPRDVVTCHVWPPRVDHSPATVTGAGETSLMPSPRAANSSATYADSVT